MCVVEWECWPARYGSIVDNTSDSVKGSVLKVKECSLVYIVVSIKYVIFTQLSIYLIFYYYYYYYYYYHYYLIFYYLLFYFSSCHRFSFLSVSGFNLGSLKLVFPSVLYILPIYSLPYLISKLI